MKKRKCAFEIFIICVGIAVIVLVLFMQYKGRAATTDNSYLTIASCEKNFTPYIGYGYNVATKGYIHEKNINASAADNFIFNMTNSDKDDVKTIMNTNVKVDNSSKLVETSTIEGKDIKAYVEQFKMNITKKKFTFIDKLDWIPFVTDVYGEVGGTFNKKNTTTRKSAFVKNTVEVRDCSITWMLEEENYYKYLNNRFKKDLLDMEPNELFSKYGTHFFRSVILGGKLEYKASITANTSSALNAAVAQFKIKVNDLANATSATPTPTATQNWMGRGNNSPSPQDIDEISNVNGSKNWNISIDCSSYCYGGSTNQYSSVFSTIADNIASDVNINVEGKGENAKMTSNDISLKTVDMATSYNNWLGTVGASPALIDIRDQYSLYPIWDLLDYFQDNDPTISEREAVARKEELKKAFNEYGLDNYNNIIKKYENETEDSLFTEIESEVTGVDYLSVYDRDDKLSENDAKIHEGFKLGNVYVTNAGKTSDGKYMLNDSSFEVSYKLAQDPNNLPLDSDLYYKHKLVSDLTHVSSVNGYGNIFSFWKQYAPMKGGYYVQVIYNDNQSDSESGCNLLKKKNKGDSVVMYTSKPDEVEKHGGVKEIKVLFIYKTQASSLLTSPFYKWLQEGTITFE